MWIHRTKRQEAQRPQPSRLWNRRLILRRLHSDERGTAAIEFGVIGSVLFGLILGTIDFSVAMTINNSLEAATNLSSRLGKTGYVAADSTQEQTIRDEVKRRVGTLIDIDDLEITQQEYNDFGSLKKPDRWEDTDGDGKTEWIDVDKDGFKDGAPGLGSSGNIVVYRIVYPWKPLTPVVAGVVGEDGVINLTAYSVVKNEPY